MSEDKIDKRREQNRIAAKRSRDRKRRASALPNESEHSRKIVSDIIAERDLTVCEHELVRQCGHVIAELEELDRILRHRTAEWLTAALEEVEEIMGPGVQVFINPDPMLAAVDRKRTLLKGLVGELRQWKAMAERANPAARAPAAPPTQPVQLHQAPGPTGGGESDFDLFGAS